MHKKMQIHNDKKFHGDWQWPWTVYCPCCKYGSAFYRWETAMQWAQDHILGAHK